MPHFSSMNERSMQTTQSEPVGKRSMRVKNTFLEVATVTPVALPPKSKTDSDLFCFSRMLLEEAEHECLASALSNAEGDCESQDAESTVDAECADAYEFLGDSPSSSDESSAPWLAMRNTSSVNSNEPAISGANSLEKLIEAPAVLSSSASNEPAISGANSLENLIEAPAVLPSSASFIGSHLPVAPAMIMWNFSGPVMTWVPVQRQCCAAVVEQCVAVESDRSEASETSRDASSPSAGTRQAGPAAENNAPRLSGEAVNPSAIDGRTTVMLRNLPNKYTAAMVLSMLDAEGFAGLYDFFYLPMDLENRVCFGYAFVNLTAGSHVARFWNKFQGFNNWVIPSRKACGVTWSATHQGFNAHVKRYRNSPLMHSSIPDDYKPMMFVDGIRVPFKPSNKKGLRAPTVRARA